MHGAPASRYVAEEEINLSSETRPPPNPFRDNNSKSSSVDHENNTLEFEYVQHDSIEHERKTNTGGTFELVPLSEDDNNVEMADFDDEEDRRHSSSCAPFSGDDYHTSGTMLPQKLYQYIYPPDVPRTVQLFRPENIAVPACYLLVGLLQGLSGPFTNVYPLDLNATEAQQATISSLKSLPSTFKLAFGFLSDNFPLAGYSRKSYMLIGWIVTSLSMCLLILFSDLTMEAVTLSNEESEEEEDNAERFLPVSSDAVVGSPPSIPFLSFTLLMFGTGFWFADVMGDSIVAEKAKLEPESSRGQLQSTCYACRFFGLMVAAPFSTVIYSTYGPKAVVVLMAGLPALITPLIFMLKETKNVPVESTKKQCAEIWNTVCSRAVWQPMGFVYLYNVLQILLIYGITFGLSPFLFALGDDCFADFIGGIQFLPTTIMMVHLCPSGSEGASYAMFTTMSNSAYTLASAFSTLLLGVWDVSKEAMESGDLTGMVNLTALTTIIQVSGVLFVGLLPRTKEDLANLHADPLSGSKIGGFIFLFVTFSSVLYSLVVGVLNIIKPGWAGES
eukprot:scaffold15922_cov66-Cyclotella_meneghiniana.AAC.6